ncbi:MAG TPA: ABC transporter permease [Actinomycetota bacterium]|jgi:peptide/nickel transport system permease protein|nr:ABC transporter permease [Actinomycetota bacterium]
MRGYVARKVLGAAGTLLFVMLFNFVLFRVMPGSPVDTIARNQRLSPGEIQALIADFGLDRPLPEQVPGYLWDTVRGNLGVSYTSGRSVVSVLAERVWPTVVLVLPATIISVSVGVWLGIHAGWRRGSGTDAGSVGASLVLYSTPEGWLGMMLLVVFGVWLGVFPLGGYSSSPPPEGAAYVADVMTHAFLPVVTLALAYIGEYVLIMRSSMVEVTHEEFLTTARAKGLTDRDVRRRHAVPNALLPIVTLIFYSFGFVLGGAVVIESIFNWPGLGLLTFQAIDNQDFPVIQGVFLLSSFLVIAFNLAADLSYGYIDPRVHER